MSGVVCVGYPCDAVGRRVAGRDFPYLEPDDAASHSWCVSFAAIPAQATAEHRRATEAWCAEGFAEVISRNLASLRREFAVRTTLGASR